ncbi:MAG: hypothetical protein R3E39_26380 [Anaerolineae bacterium]
MLSWLRGGLIPWWRGVTVSWCRDTVSGNTVGGISNVREVTGSFFVAEGMSVLDVFGTGLGTEDGTLLGAWFSLSKSP